MIVIPMAGKSSRFFKEGFKVPKYELSLGGRTVLHWVLQTFKESFGEEKFIFATRQEFGARNFVASVCEENNVSDYALVDIAGSTRGQADTVRIALGEAGVDGEPIHIFNADSFHLGFEPPIMEHAAGSLDVFVGQGNHWSFVEPHDIEGLVKRTTEKVRVSNLCSDGMYSFADRATFNEAFERGSDSVEKEYGEVYIAPLYNFLISAGRKVRFRVIDNKDLFFCGTPEEYRSLLGSERFAAHLE